MRPEQFQPRIVGKRQPTKTHVTWDHLSRAFEVTTRKRTRGRCVYCDSTPAVMDSRGTGSGSGASGACVPKLEHQNELDVEQEVADVAIAHNVGFAFRAKLARLTDFFLTAVGF